MGSMEDNSSQICPKAHVLGLICETLFSLFPFHLTSEINIFSGAFAGRASAAAPAIVAPARSSRIEEVLIFLFLEMTHLPVHETRGVGIPVS